MKSVLESLDVNKATGHDGISVKILKAGDDEISLTLSILYNSGIKKGQWPCDWKKGDWTLIYKKDDRHAKNYRPITVLSCVKKVFERL